MRHYQHHQHHHHHHEPSSPRYVFCHYMVGGMEACQARLDVEQAKAMGLDAFALNIISTDWWSTDTVRWLFEAARELDFKVFFSFDMNHFSHPSQFIPWLKEYYADCSYFQYNDLPFVSTFWGATLSFDHSTPNEGWQREYREALAADGIETYFVPSFSNAESGPQQFFERFPVVDGVMNWESWPWHSEGKKNVSMELDKNYLHQARRAEKTFMMTISSHQFKHMDEHQNWYRRGELNLVERMPQILALKPDFLQILTWNDGGESHYIGNVWPSAITHDSVRKYTSEYDHSAWQILLKSLITAYKSNSHTLLPTSNRIAEGVFWYRTIFTHSPCTDDIIGKPYNWQSAEDVVNVAVILGPEAEDICGTDRIRINVSSGGVKVGSKNGRLGLNAFSAPLRAGMQMVEVVDGDGCLILCGEGKMMVDGDSDFHNYNYVVTALAAMERSSKASNEVVEKGEGNGAMERGYWKA